MASTKLRVPPMGPPGKPKGWLFEEENYDWIESLPEGVPFTSNDYEPFRKDFPKPSTWLRIENQNGFGSCQGHALSSVAEVVYNYATGGKVIQLSRWMAYVGTQIIDGINGDRGSTISGGAKLAETKGICPEHLYPYPSRYVRRVSAAQYAAAEPFKMRTFVRMRSVEDVVNFVDSMCGAIDIGVRWGRGGHAIAITETVRGKEEVKWANSWGTNYGEDGWGVWTYRELEKKLRESYTVAIGMTEMPAVEPREVDWGLFD